MKNGFNEQLIAQIELDMTSYFASDKKRINHAKAVKKYAAMILEKETANVEIVLSAALLHDIGIHQAEKKYGKASGKYQEIEGPSIARKLMQDMLLEDAFIDKVCEIISKHHTKKGLNTSEFQILYEADWLVNLQDDFKNLSYEKKMKIINEHFETAKGKELAVNLFKPKQVVL